MMCFSGLSNSFRRTPQSREYAYKGLLLSFSAHQNTVSSCVYQSSLVRSKPRELAASGPNILQYITFIYSHLCSAHPYAEIRKVFWLWTSQQGVQASTVGPHAMSSGLQGVGMATADSRWLSPTLVLARTLQQQPRSFIVPSTLTAVA